MSLVSPVLELAGRLGGPRFEHRLRIWRTLRWRNYEPEFYFLDHLVDPTRAAIDVGANEGIYAERMAQLSPLVHCFEPNPSFAAALRAKLDSRVAVHELALSNRKGEAELRVPYCGAVELHGTATLEADNPLPGSTHVKPVRCTTDRLDEAVRDPVGFIKIDVEGHELAVLEGASRILAEDQPALLIESEKRHNRNAPETIFALLSGYGYGGFFLLRGRPIALSAFRADLHQRVENFGSSEEVYVNNFIFLPGRADT